MLKQLTKALVERALQAELTTHLGYEKHSPEGHNSGNSRNGESRKRLKGDFGTVEIAVPRDREASFARAGVGSLMSGYQLGFMAAAAASPSSASRASRWETTAPKPAATRSRQSGICS